MQELNTASAAQPAALVGGRVRAGSFLLRFLPRGHSLPDAIWQQRHKAISLLLWFHVVVVPLVGILRRNDIAHVFLETAILVAAAVVATARSFSRNVRMVAATFGLITSSALLTHFSGGLIEMHFHFFVMVAVVTLYQAWLPFLVSIAYVVMHHGVMGALDPTSVYNHAAAVAQPWKWALVHGFFIMGESTALLVVWRMNEDARADAERNYQQKIREEKARREAQDRYRHIVENAVEGIFDVDATTGALTANLALARMLGYTSADEMMDTNVDLSTHWVCPDRREEFVRLLTEQETVSEFEFRARRTDDSLVWLTMSARGTRDADGNMVRFQGVVEDITQRKESERHRDKLEQQLLQAQKMEAVGRIAGGIAHDFNNLLGVITNYAAFLRQDLAPSDPRLEDVEEIHAAGQRGAKLVHQLLAFSRKEIVSPKVLDPSVAVRDMTKLLERTIGEDVELEVTCADDACSVRIDPSQIEQVLMNLAINARDAMPTGGKLQIETVTVVADAEIADQHPGMIPGEYCCLSVSDTGVGMTDDVKARVFEPFFTTKPLGEGTGLGLAMVYGIVKRAEGYVSVYSEAGEGTTFRVYLPNAEERPDTTQVAPVVAPARAAGETILLVEDEPAVRQLTDRILVRGGYNVIAMASVEDAVALFEDLDGSIDLLLTDVIMPTMSGKELSDQLSRISNGFPTLYMSGYTDEIVARRGMLEAAEQFIQKPFTSEGLLLKVREVLAAHARSHQSI